VQKSSVRGRPACDLPLILLARLAVDRRFARRGLAHAVISEAFRISVRVADAVGGPCIITDAYPDWISWYANYVRGDSGRGGERATADVSRHEDRARGAAALNAPFNCQGK
jgi:hypothetical protein